MGIRIRAKNDQASRPKSFTLLKTPNNLHSFSPASDYRSQPVSMELHAP